MSKISPNRKKEILRKLREGSKIDKREYDEKLKEIEKDQIKTIEESKNLVDNNLQNLNLNLVFK